MRRIGRVEAWLGLGAGAYGLIVTATATYLIQNTGAAPCGPPTGGCIAGVNAVTVFFMAAFAILFALAAVSAALHGFRGSAAGVALLWVSVAALALFTLLGVFSVGGAMLPGTLTLIGAAIIAWIRLIESRLNWLRWIELLAGTGSGALGIAAMVALFFWPSIEYNGPNYGGTFSIASFYGLAGVLPALLLVAAVSYLVAGGAMTHAVYGSRAGYALLALGVAAFVSVEIAGAIILDTTYYMRSVAQFLAPGAALAVIALAVASTHLLATPEAVAGGV